MIGKEIAVTGEGPTDYGTKEFGGEWLWGPVGVYLYKVAEKLNKSINLIPIERKLPAGIQNYDTIIEKENTYE